MTQLALEELRDRKKKQTIKLIEVADVTRRIAEAAERGDNVAAEMLLNEREQPVRELKELEEGVREYLTELPEEDAIRAAGLLRGDEAESEAEKPLAEQAGQFRRILASVLSLDEQLSLRMGGSNSIYKTFRK